MPPPNAVTRHQITATHHPSSIIHHPIHQPPISGYEIRDSTLTKIHMPQWARAFIKPAIQPIDRIPAGYYGSDSGNEDMPDELLRELQMTKKSMFGTDIPIDEELRQSAINAENAFVEAMLEQTSQFKQLKSELGSDRAVEMFMGRIQEADAQRDETSQNVKDDPSWDQDFVEKIKKSQIQGIISDEDTTSWQ
eukprot:scaffold10683_cov94-Cyclotella_meneghiniana.AAC.8